MVLVAEPTKAEYKPYMEPFTDYCRKPALAAAITGIALGALIFIGGIALVIALGTDVYTPEMNPDLFLILTGGGLGLGLISIVGGGKYIQYKKQEQVDAAIHAFKVAH